MIYFLSILDNEFIKIGYTEQPVEKRKITLQTGNPYEIKILFSVDGSLREEKEIHKGLKEVFERIKVFNNPINEWYPGNNPIVKMFISNVQGNGIDFALENLKPITHWKSKVGDEQIFTVRNLEKALHRNGFSRSAAKHLIWENKTEFVALWEKYKPQINSDCRNSTNEQQNPRVILRKGPRWELDQAEATTSLSL